jgi:hypothetical protein
MLGMRTLAILLLAAAALVLSCYDHNSPPPTPHDPTCPAGSVICDPTCLPGDLYCAARRADGGAPDATVPRPR